MKFKCIKPMLPIEKPLAEDLEENFIHEIKWDGFRALAYLNGTEITLQSRNGHSLNARFPQIVSALAEMKKVAILDGELIALGKDGKPQFSLLQSSAHHHQATIVFMVFDLLFWQGRYLCSRTWEERRHLLEALLIEQGSVVVSPVLSGTAKANFQFIAQHNLEGIVSKQKDSPYLPGTRSTYWRKQKLRKSLDCIVVGLNFTGKRIRSLAVGAYDDDGNLIYIGNVGSGLRQKELEFLQEATNLLLNLKCPVVNPPKTHNEQIWFKPYLVAEVEYLELTSELILRQPSFKRFRFDKDPFECKLGVD